MSTNSSTDALIPWQATAMETDNKFDANIWTRMNYIPPKGPCNFKASLNKIDDAITSRWTREDGSFDREAYEMDEEVQELLANRKRLGIQGDMSSNGNILMPDKARSTLVGQPHRKRIRTEKTG